MNWTEIVIAWYTEIKGWKILEGREVDLVKASLSGYANRHPNLIERVFECEADPNYVERRSIIVNPGIPSLESIFEEIKSRNLSVAIGGLKSGDWGISIYREPTNEEYGQEVRGWDTGGLNQILAEALVQFVRKFAITKG